MDQRTHPWHIVTTHPLSPEAAMGEADPWGQGRERIRRQDMAEGWMVHDQERGLNGEAKPRCPRLWLETDPLQGGHSS